MGSPQHVESGDSKGTVTMPELAAYLIAALAGLITGAVQWSVFMREPDLEKSFLAHLDDLKGHLVIAKIMMILVAGLLAWSLNRLDVVLLLVEVFTVSWVAGVVVRAMTWRFVTAEKAMVQVSRDS